MGFRRHFGPPSKAFRPLAASLWPVRSFSDSRQASCGLSVACPKPASSLLMGFRRQREAFWTGFTSLSAAGRPLAASLWPVQSLPPLFLWASEGNVKHFGPASKASRQPAGLLRPLCGLSEACLLSSYGLPKATLGILDRLQKPLGSRQCGLSEACLLSSYGLPKATLGIFGSASNAPQSLTAALPSSRQLAGLPLLFFWASESDVRHFGPASNAPQSLTAALPSFRQASEGDV